MTHPSPHPTPGVPTARLVAHDLTLGYDGLEVVHGLDLAVPSGEFTVVIGPNACGKSTLLKALARLLEPCQGTVCLDGRSIFERRTVEVARTLGLLPQSNVVPDGIRVADLVGRGRFAHQRFLRRWTADDQQAVLEAMAETGISHLGERVVDELSGGQRQRVWLATVLAQGTDLLLLDEPTTYLDVNHQLEVLDLCGRLQRRGHTVVAVLHDLNQAVRHATHLVVMNHGAVVASGPPAEVVDADLLAEVFRIEARVWVDPLDGRPVVVPVRPLGRPTGPLGGER